MEKGLIVKSINGCSNNIIIIAGRERSEALNQGSILMMCVRMCTFVSFRLRNVAVTSRRNVAVSHLLARGA